MKKALILLMLCTLFTPFVTSAQQAQSRTPVTITNEPTKEGEQLSPSEMLEQEKFDPFKRPSITTQAVVLTSLALMPFIIMILTSFLKIVIVLSLLRSALGVQQAPPNQVINGIAFMLSVYVMYPTALKMYDAAQGAINAASQEEQLVSAKTATYFIAIAEEAREPLRNFLIRNTANNHRALFYKMAYRVIPQEYRSTLKPNEFVILVPAYITTQLKEAFQIGVLIYIPFFVVDLVVSNILLAMGMMMLSPVTISMPLKLFLLVMLDGWTLLVEGLVTSFR